MALLVACLLALLAPSVPTATAAPGTVAGRVSLVKNGTPVADASNCVVWIEGLRLVGGPVPAASGRPGRVEMKSQGKKFVPRVVAVAKNADVEFPNVDPIYHNVFSVSPANRFDLGLYRSGGSKGKKFEEPGIVRVYCNIHPQMVGFVMVVDSDFAAVTGADGAFRFENVPAGNWQIRVWNEEAGETRIPASVRGRTETPVAIRLDATEFRLQAHKNKYGKDYPPQAGTDDERY
jgi:plastocyanin